MEQHPLYRLYVELGDKIDKIASNGPITGASADFSDIIVRLNQLEAKPSYDEVINQLSKSLEVLKRENEELKTQMEQLIKIENLEARIYNIEVEPKIDLTPVNNRLDNLENNNYNERITTLETRVDNVEQYIKTITDLTYRINDLEKRPELSQRLSAVETAISNMSN